MRRRQRPISPLYFFLLLIPAFFTVFLLFQGGKNGFQIRLTPAGRLECTQADGCTLPDVQSLNFLVVGDIGGLPVYPYYSYAQQKVARAMVHAARRNPLHFVVNVGDNFYFNGVRDAFDPRFEDSFEEVYDHPELLVPWYTVAGNHDHIGNITAQIAHTDFSNKWTFPSLFYKVRISFAGGGAGNSATTTAGEEEGGQSAQQPVAEGGEVPSPQQQNQNVPPPPSFPVPSAPAPVVLEILFLDTIVLCGNTVDVQGDSLFSWLFAKKQQPNGPEPKYRQLAAEQWAWIERELAQSSADYLLVVGHYPVYSTCEHGNFGCLQRLDALLHRHRVNAYLSGHDHNMQHIRMSRQAEEDESTESKNHNGTADDDTGPSASTTQVDYIVCGASSRADRSAKHLDDVPKEALLFRYPTGWNPFSQIGFSNGGFIQAQLERDQGHLWFYNGKQELKYSFGIRPRRRGRGKAAATVKAAEMRGGENENDDTGGIIVGEADEERRRRRRRK